MNDEQGYAGKCESNPATGQQSVSAEQACRMYEEHFARQEKEFSQALYELSARVGDLERDRDSLVERHIERRLANTRGGQGLDQCATASGSIRQQKGRY